MDATEMARRYVFDLRGIVGSSLSHLVYTVIVFRGVSAGLVMEIFLPISSAVLAAVMRQRI